MLQDRDGQVIEAHSASAGLDYPGIGPQLAALAEGGRIEVAAATDRELWLLEFADRKMLATQFARVARATGGVLVPGSSEPIARVRAELDEYFAGRRRTFSVPLATAGTAFQEQVWSTLREIPHGETRSYAELAAAVGRPSAIRAVGRANGDNRLAIVIPCHRVVGAGGALTGYGGGLWRKHHLLNLEARNEDARPSASLREGLRSSTTPVGVASGRRPPRA